MSQLIREKCGDNPPENRIVMFHAKPGKGQVAIKEWANALRNAVPQNDEDRQMVDELKMGLAKAGGAAEVGVLAQQALAVVEMGSAVKPPIAVPAVK